MRDQNINSFLARTRFTVSAPDFARCPSECGPEIGFCGRSNAGKSSALNALTGQKNLARTSKTPGRTQLINFFEVPKTGGFLIDLPGYGFAKVPNALKRNWEQNVSEFLAKRRTLLGLILLMDIRNAMTSLDLKLLKFADHQEIDTLLLLTKCDKLSRSQAIKSNVEVSKKRPQSTVLNFSSSNKIGVREASEWVMNHLTN